MRILFHAPFKPLDHPHPSGDRVIGQGLFDFLADRGHEVKVASRLRTRWIFRRPGSWPAAALEIRRARSLAARFRPHLWLTFHTYYKAPDVLGPAVCGPAGIPYAVFQGMYSTRVRKNPLTRPGYELNRRALMRADHVFTNRLLDRENLLRLLPEERVTYVRPGLDAAPFAFDPSARERLRARWGAEGLPVALCCAMLRDDVKSRGVAFTIRTAKMLADAGLDFLLVVAGDGVMRGPLESLAGELLPGRTRFVGKVERQDMAGVFSAADALVFPGINESLGMVYLEAQACGLPVAAFDNGGIPEVVANGQTGILTPPFDRKAFASAVARLLLEPETARRMGRAGARYVRENHDLYQNYGKVLGVLENLAARRA
ncbi:MAG: glycosyltransferase family 4 protein [Deltaproteobacteria bacterium]|nr:glycosyltransferase family 4 protein [Deltaproteobacteria bacterium]